MYKAVLFDLFGTLIESPSMTAYRQMVAEIAEVLGQTFETFQEPWMSINDGRLDGSFGSSEGDILAAAELVGASVSDSQMAQCMDLRRSITRKFLVPKTGVIAMLEELNAMGCDIGLVTDCVYDVPAVWLDTEFAAYFAASHYSCVTHVRKPDSKAYQVVLDELGVSASETLFVGDGGSDELNGAVRVGIDAVQIDDLITEDEGAVSVLRVGVVDWDGPAIKSMSEVPDYVRNRS
ncbi:MAG: HAD family hydrolase [Dehalococcoidia bacterium]|jgi:putative hydrolase of the HAD superfamily|tara:strand:+ start:140 stop:844 length:705 start_codon:yes stop_codon:yes gene_type:complete